MAAKNKDTQFYKEMDKIFEDNLFYEEKDCIFIKDISQGKILKNLPYQKLLFDSNLKIYKIENEKIVPVDNPNFQAVIGKKQIYKPKIDDNPFK